MTANPDELIIIGSGPAGYTAAIYAARAQLNPLVIEGSVTSGGALMTTTEVENFPGFPDGIDGPDLMGQLRKQAERFGARIVPADAVSVDLAGPVKTVVDGSGRDHHAHAVVLAMGSGYRRLGLPDEDRLAGHGVSWCATCDGFFFRGQEIAVVGGGDSALEEATFLTRFADKVYLIHRRPELRASKAMQARAIADPKLKFVLNARIAAIQGGQSVTGLTLSDTTTDETRELPVTGLFVAIGHDPRSELVREAVDVDAAGYVRVTHPTTHTNVRGVFACGDLVDSRYRQAITAAGSGCAAGLDAERYLAEIH